MTNTAERLKGLRIKSKLSMAEVAEKLGVTTQSVFYYENGSRVPRDEVKKQLATLYGVTVGELFFDED